MSVDARRCPWIWAPERLGCPTGSALISFLPLRMECVMNRGIMRAMSEENLATVRRSYEAFARGDLDATVADADPELVTFRGYPDAATFHGPEGFMQAVAEWVENFDDFSLKPEEFIDANNEHVVVRVHQSAV